MISVKTTWLRDRMAVPGDVLLCVMGRMLAASHNSVNG